MLEIKNISKTYKDFALSNFSINVEKGDYFMILGVSGAGKSLLLELIAGLVKPDSGKIIIDGKDITDQKIQNRKIGLLFQDYAIFPHLSVKDNIAYPLRLKRFNSSQLKAGIHEFAEKTGVLHLLHRDTSTLSGGELQRVALARTLAMEPECLLLDEPLAALDVQLKEGLRTLLRKLNRDGLTIIHITHDFEETISLANQIAVLHDGKIVQQGSPQNVFRNPGNEFVARMTGIKNFFKTRLSGKSPGGSVTATINDKVQINIISDHSNCIGNILIRRRDIQVMANMPEVCAENCFEGTVAEIIPQKIGMDAVIDIGIPVTANISEKQFKELGLVISKKVWISFKPEVIRFLHEPS